MDRPDIPTMEQVEKARARAEADRLAGRVPGFMRKRKWDYQFNLDYNLGPW